MLGRRVERADTGDISTGGVQTFPVVPHGLAYFVYLETSSRNFFVVNSYVPSDLACLYCTKFPFPGNIYKAFICVFRFPEDF